MTDTQPERYDYPRPGVKTQKVPNQDDIDKLYKNFTRWDTTLATALIIEGAMRAEEVLQLEKDEVVEKEKSFQISITAGQGKRDIEVVKSPRLTKLMRKTLEQDTEELISLKRRTYRSRLKAARKKAGDQIPEEVKVSHLGLRATGIRRLIDKGFCIADVEAYTGSSNSGFIEELFEQHREEPFIDNWETDDQDAKKYVHANQEDEELAAFRAEGSSGKSKVEELLNRMVSENRKAREQDSEGKDLGYWNKDTFEVFAEKTPETCPDCDKTNNFKLYRKKPEGAIQVTDLFILKHSCGWEKDITPWRLA